jgi:hypothetical protein
MLAAADTIEQLCEALEPLAAKELPPRPRGNAGAYSFLHSEIKAARAALAKARGEQ